MSRNISLLLEGKHSNESGKSSGVIIVILAVWLLFAMHIIFPNNGGAGLNIPQNYISVIFLMVFCTVIWIVRKRDYVVTDSSKFIFYGLVILSIPLIYTKPIWLSSGVWHIMATLFGGWIYLSILQVDEFKKLYSSITLLIMCASLVQALILIYSIFSGDLIYCPVNSVVDCGIFQQRNVLSSFFASGYAATYLLYFFQQDASKVHLRILKHTKKEFLLFVMCMLSMVIAITQSRTGLIGLVTVVILFYFSDPDKSKRKWAVICSSTGYLLGLGICFYYLSSVPDLEHSGSTLSRINLMVNLYSYLKTMPLYGYGYGSFEYTFQHHIIDHFPFLHASEIFRHPHNEEIYWIAEGGCIALVGLLIIFVPVLKVTFRSWKYRKENPQPLMFLICTIPVMVHTQLEFPFYISFLHYFIVISFFSFADKIVSPNKCRTTLFYSPINKLILGFGCLIAMVFLTGGLTGSIKLSNLEKSMMTNGYGYDAKLNSIEMIMNKDRSHFDDMTSLLLTYNVNHDVKTLLIYRQFCESYLQTRVDKNVYVNLIAILNYFGDKRSAEHYELQEQIIFPNKPAFIPTGN